MNKKRRPRARKSGAKQRKPKFLSLRLQFPADEIKSSAEMEPIIQESQAENRELQDPENVALFLAEGDGGATTTLNGLLNSTSSSAAADSISSHANSNSSRVGDFSPASASASLSFSYREERAALVRTAMRNRERDPSGEKWVRYSEVVERKVKEEEVSSSSVDVQRRRTAEVEKGIHGGPLLKLDYDEILNAWSNKGPLYIDGESSQIVPDISHGVVSHEASNISQLHDYNYQGLSFGCSVGFWTVPELFGLRSNDVEEETKVGQREASVLRYKEKRQNRLFCKKIRYEVRKLNAEKRPRLKGRFVKRSSE